MPQFDQSWTKTKHIFITIWSTENPQKMCLITPHTVCGISCVFDEIAYVKSRIPTCIKTEPELLRTGNMNKMYCNNTTEQILQGAVRSHYCTSMYSVSHFELHKYIYFVHIYRMLSLLRHRAGIA